jgi:hypothetical protein
MTTTHSPFQMLYCVPMIDILIGGYHVHSQKDTFETRSARKIRLKQIMSLLLKDIRSVHLIWCVFERQKDSMSCTFATIAKYVSRCFTCLHARALHIAAQASTKLDYF